VRRGGHFDLSVVELVDFDIEYLCFAGDAESEVLLPFFEQGFDVAVPRCPCVVEPASVAASLRHGVCTATAVRSLPAASACTCSQLCSRT
jgi:hypothetical protein